MSVRALVTGGAGFIGSHLCDELLSRGQEVVALDDLSTGSADNVAHLDGEDRFTLTVAAVEDDAVAGLVERADVVYHLAASVGVNLIVESPVRTIENNVHGTEVVLAHAQAFGRPVFVASSSEVYGKSSDLPFREDGDMVLGATTRGRWSYAAAKAVEEFLALAYHKERGLPTVVGRLFNTVGPRQTGRYGMVVPTLVRQALEDAPLTVFGDGTQRRCFCHVADVVRAIADLMESDRHHGEVFNVGGTEEVSIMELAERVREATGADAPIVTVPYDEAYERGFEDMPRRKPDIGKIRAAVGWSPSHGLGDILADVIAHERVRAAVR